MVKMFLYFLLGYTCSLTAQNTSTAEIEGSVVSVSGEGVIWFKKQKLPDQVFETLDSVLISNDAPFKFSYHSIEPGYYQLGYKDGKAAAWKLILIDEGTHHLRVVIDTMSVAVQGGRVFMRKIKLSGSKDNELLDHYFDLRKYYYSDRIFPTEVKMKALSKSDVGPYTLDSLNASLVKYRSEMVDKLNNFVLTEMGTSIAVYQTMSVWDNADLVFMNTVMEKFRQQKKISFILPVMEEKYKHLVKTRLLNQTSPLFTLKDANDHEVKLEDFIGKKLILLDFWASWCGPCIKEMRGYKDVQEKILAKDILIISISTDKVRADWTRSLSTNKFPWTQVIDEAGATAKLFGITELPTNFMIDKNGTVIGKNLTLTDILKY